MADPSRYKSHNLKNKYGITIEQHNQMLANQGGVCALCKKPFGNEIPCVDHCHKTGKIGGLLHRNCNSAIGLLNDDPVMTNQATDYLLKRNEKNA